MRRLSPVGQLVVVAVVLTACPHHEAPSPLIGETRYLCCNLHYEEPEINDANYLRGATVPFGTRIEITKVSHNRVTFQPVGHPPLTLAFKYGEKNLTMEQYIDRLFVTEDPRAEFARPGHDKKLAADISKRRKLIDEGVVQKGMTKHDVLLALGYPPAHRTPSLDASAWTYWQNRWVTMVVHFDGDKVSRIER
jgi:hypothetical protein